MRTNIFPVLVSLIALATTAIAQTPELEKDIKAPGSEKPLPDIVANTTDKVPQLGLNSPPVSTSVPVSQQLNSEPTQKLQDGKIKMILSEVIFQNGAVYEILNKADGNALSFEILELPATPIKVLSLSTKPYVGFAGQKWRLQKAYFGNSYKLIPTLKETAVMNLGPAQIGFFGKFISFGNQKYWNLVNVGDGGVKIQNRQKPSLCLISPGGDQEVNVAPCQNKPNQQWNFILI